MESDSIQYPNDKGEGILAIANTRSYAINLRPTPSKDLPRVGYVKDYAAVIYYPKTRTPDRWVWVEIADMVGWVSEAVIDFENAIDRVTTPNAPTPYDGHIAVWHFKGESVTERRMQGLISSLKRRTPNVTQLWVKTHDGFNWEGDFDSGDMAINGPADIDRWVTALEAEGIEFHAWCVLNGLDIQAEAEITKQVCNRPGVKSLILDIEPFHGFWSGKPEAIRPLMSMVREGIPKDFHIGMAVDPRPHHFDRIYPGEWFIYIDSIHPMCYWRTFQRPVREVISEAYDVWGHYGRPIIPILQGNAELVDQQDAHTYATNKHNAKGISWWAYHTISRWSAINKPINLPQEREDQYPREHYTEEVIVHPELPSQFRRGTYTKKNEFIEFETRWNWKSLTTRTNVGTSDVWVQWKPEIRRSGHYEITAFIPSRNASTARARYKIHGVEGLNSEVVVDVNQFRYRNQWVTLGVFALDRKTKDAGVVFLNDATGEDNRRIAFDAIRWRRVHSLPFVPRDDLSDSGQLGGVFTADGFDSPVGKNLTIRPNNGWPNGWLDANPFGNRYAPPRSSGALHTGADLNLVKNDLGERIKASASGIIIYAGYLTPRWGHTIVIRHDPLHAPDGPVYYTRYAHVQNILVQPGQRVDRNEPIAEVGMLLVSMTHIYILM